MPRGMRVLGMLVAVVSLTACGDEPPAGNGTGQGKLSVKAGHTLEGEPCTADGPACPEGLTCATVDLASGAQARCVDLESVCEDLECSSGQCLVMESYPVQVRCSQ